MPPNPVGPWNLVVRSDSSMAQCRWTYSRFGRAKDFLAQKLRDDAKDIQEGLCIIYKSDLFLKEASGDLAQAANVHTVSLRFYPTYYLDRQQDIPSIRFFNEFIRMVALSSHLRTLVLNVPGLTVEDEENAIAAFARCRLERIHFDSHFSSLFWMRMLDVSRCHAVDVTISCNPSLDRPIFLTAIQENMRGEFAMWTIQDCLKRRVRVLCSDETKPIVITQPKDDQPNRGKGSYRFVALGDRAFFALVGLPRLQLEQVLPCAAERMRMKTVTYEDCERTLVLRDCQLAGGQLPDLTMFGDGLRRLRVFGCLLEA